MYLVPVTSESVKLAVAIAEADFALTLATGKFYEFVSSTACWIKQGNALLLTCVTKASLVAGDSFTVTVDGRAVVFQLDKSGTDVILAGRTRLDVSGATTAAQVATAVRTGVLAVFTTLAITDNADGTLTCVMTGARLLITEAVGAAGFTVTASTALAATAGSASMYVPANKTVILDAKHGQTVSAIRDAADGSASLTRLRFITGA